LTAIIEVPKRTEEKPHRETLPRRETKRMLFERR